MTRKRLFVAIDLPDSLRKILADLNPNIRGVRWTEPQIVLKLYWKNAIGVSPIALRRSRMLRQHAKCVRSPKNDRLL